MTASVRWTGDECFVYQIPPRRSGSRGHRADAWDLAAPALTCSIQVIEVGEKCLVKLFDNKTKKMAACSEICILEEGERSKLDFFLEAVVDSSRYYVLRVGDKKTKRVIYLGIGFRSRPDASSFRETLLEYARFRRRDYEAKKLQEKFNETVQLEKEDDVFKIGQNQTVSIPGIASRSKSDKSVTTPTEEFDESLFRLEAPSEALAKKKKTKNVAKDKVTPMSSPSTPASGDAEDDDDWGDFTTAD
eukprot:g2199.t1